MPSLHSRKGGRNLRASRYLVGLLVCAVMAVLLLVTPVGVPEAEAGCYTFGPSLDEIVDTVIACPSFYGGIDVTFNVRSDVNLSGSCGDAHVSVISVDNGTGYDASNFVIHLDPADPNSNVGFSFRLNTYPTASPWNGAPKKVHSSLMTLGSLPGCAQLFPFS